MKTIIFLLMTFVSLNIFAYKIASIELYDSTFINRGEFTTVVLDPDGFVQSFVIKSGDVIDINDVKKVIIIPTKKNSYKFEIGIDPKVFKIEGQDSGG